jgi:hypothetical protein
MLFVERYLHSLKTGQRALYTRKQMIPSILGYVSTIPDSFPQRREKAPIRYGMYNFQKLSETTSLRCNNSSENSVPKRYG